MTKRKPPVAGLEVVTVAAICPRHAPAWCLPSPDGQSTWTVKDIEEHIKNHNGVVVCEKCGEECRLVLHKTLPVRRG